MTQKDIEDIVRVGVNFEILNDCTPYKKDEAFKHIAQAIHQAQEKELNKTHTKKDT